VLLLILGALFFTRFCDGILIAKGNWHLLWQDSGWDAVGSKPANINVKFEPFI
jgi:hypothetical protein